MKIIINKEFRPITINGNITNYGISVDGIVKNLSTNKVIKPKNKNKEVCDILNIEYNNKIRCLINNIRFKNIESSTTIKSDNDYYNIIIK